MRTATPTVTRHTSPKSHHHAPPVPLRRKRIPDQRQAPPACATFRICSAAPASGPESYAIIEQGRIGQILSNKPADRRAIIEEAAGIGKYKTRKRLAEAKLESARQNLSRVFDILEEVGRQVNSLKRQASKAKRYEELRTEMVAPSAPRGVRPVPDAGARSREAGARSESGADRISRTFRPRCRSKEQEHTRTQESCYRTEAALTAARGRVAELNLESERTRGRLALQAKQIGAIEERLAAGEAETQELEARHQRESGRTGSASRKRSPRSSAKARRCARALGRQDAGARRAAESICASASAASKRPPAGAAPAGRSVHAAQSTGADRRISGRDGARCRALPQGRRRRVGRPGAPGSGQGRAVRTGLSARQLELESLADRRRRVEEEIEGRGRRARRRARQKLEEICATRLSRQKARKDSLEEILSHRAYTTESVKRLFLGLEHGQHRRLPALWRAGRFRRSDRSATGKRRAKNFCTKSWNTWWSAAGTKPSAASKFMRADSDGRATFLVHPEASAASAAGAGSFLANPAVSGRLRDALRLTNGFAQAPQGLLPRLARCFLVSDRARGARAWPTAHPDCYFLLQDGVSYHGHAVSGGRKTRGRSAGAEARIARAERAGGNPRSAKRMS